MRNETENRLGTYLRDRRMRLDPATFGFAAARRRTPGLRREEVAQRANISATWYTWLEQGRGGAPSAEVLNRIAAALMLTEVEREHLFLLGLGRPPEVRYKPAESVTPRLQRMLDALEFSPALIKTPTWDIVAWNRAAAVLLTDYGALLPEQRNILRLMFGNPRIRGAQHDWESLARVMVGAFRADAVRAGAVSEVAQFVDELCRLSPDFEALWREHDVGVHPNVVKRLNHPILGPLEMEYSAFAIDGRLDLSMIVLNPMTVSEGARIRAFIAARPAPADAEAEAAAAG
ncbi:MAG: helix-turn-helix domain-containing protein [Proteobacteria bacterium]|nr:helix-turn-helix domain-containing protein [Pseudomonadota bacterium]